VLSAPGQPELSSGSSTDQRVCGSWNRLFAVSVSLVCLLILALLSLLPGRHSSLLHWPAEQPVRDILVYLTKLLALIILSTGGNYWRRRHCSNCTLGVTTDCFSSGNDASTSGVRFHVIEAMSHYSSWSRWRRLIWAENGEAKKPGPPNRNVAACSYPAIPTPESRSDVQRPILLSCPYL